MHPGPVGGCALFLVAPAPQDLDAPGFSVGSQLLGGASLANTRLPHQHGQPAPTGQRLFQGRPELAQLPLAADEDTGGGDGLAAGLRRRLRHAASIVGIGGGFQWLILRSMISKTGPQTQGGKEIFGCFLTRLAGVGRSQPTLEERSLTDSRASRSRSIPCSSSASGPLASSIRPDNPISSKRVAASTACLASM